MTSVIGLQPVAAVYDRRLLKGAEPLE
jgi:hypothetical protein